MLAAAAARQGARRARGARSRRPCPGPGSRREAGSAVVRTVPYQLPQWLRGRPGRSDEAALLHVDAAPGQAVALEPGLVFLRRAVDTAEQRRLAAEIWATGSGRRGAQHGFFRSDGQLSGPKGQRGRIFDAADRFPALADLLLPACRRWVAVAQATDPAMPSHTATHLLLLYYRAGGTLGFHRDEQANDGTGDEPVVSLSLGGEADFAWRREHSEAAKVLTLRSGDVLLFGDTCTCIHIHIHIHIRTHTHTDAHVHIHTIHTYIVYCAHLSV